MLFAPAMACCVWLERQPEEAVGAAHAADAANKAVMLLHAGHHGHRQPRRCAAPKTLEAPRTVVASAAASAFPAPGILS
jgi:hypothetical protein